MVSLRRAQALSFAAFAAANSIPTIAKAQDVTALPEITVTANRVEQPINSTGSDVTVIPGAQIQQWGAQGITETLRDVVGVTVTQTAGPGSLTAVRLRGANPGQALVMIDGIPIGAVTATDGSLDFGNLTAVDIDRIEIVRGPQSSLYGSDAMSGVINIITKKGKKGEQRRSVTIEGGSYGTIQGTATASGSVDNWIYSLGVTGMSTNGFPQYGYRVNRPLTMIDGVTPLPALPDTQPGEKGGANARLTYQISPDASIDFSLNVFGNGLHFANPYASEPADVFSSYNWSRVWIGDGFVRANATTGILTNHLTIFANVTDNSVRQTEGCSNALYVTFNCTTNYRGDRWGAEYQGELAFGGYGSLVFGARNLNESATTSQSPNPFDGSFTPIDATQTTNSVYAEYRLALLSRLDLTLGGRVDSVESGPTFVTGRVTAAYRIDETGTKLRASFGDGAKAPTLFQRFSQWGSPGLDPEENIGGEVGIDQKLFSDRLTLSATAFNTFYSNMIGFADVSSCTVAQVALGGCYYNVGKAHTSGVEVSGDATLVPDILRIRGGYTYTDARDTDTNAQVLRVPYNQGSLSAVFTGVPNLEIEPRLLLVGSRLDTDVFTGGRVALPGYARLDLITRYRFNDTFSAYVRFENLTNANYEEVYNYGVAGRAVYAGVTAKF